MVGDVSPAGETGSGSKKLAFRTLGGLGLRGRSGEEIIVRSKPALALLLYLALNRGRRQRRDKLAPLLWPDRADEQARNSLRQTLFTLKEALGAHAAAVHADGEEVWLDEAIIGADVWPFLDEADEATPIAAEQLGSIGALADGFEVSSETFETWLARERARIRDIVCDRLVHEAAQRLEASKVDDAIRWYQAVVSLDPCREDAHRALIEIYLAAGLRGAALRQYKTCASALRQELDVEPDAQTARLYELLRATPPENSEFLPSPARIDAQRSPAPAMRTAPRPRATHSRRAAGILVAMAPLVALALWMMSPLGTEKPIAPKQAAAPVDVGNAPPQAAPILSLVVLPFVNRSPESQEDWFVDGITEELTTDLSRVPNAMVIARSSAFTYKGKFADVRRIGKELNVRYAIEGSVRRDGDRIRLIAQLAETESGAQIWSERFTFDRRDLTATLDLIVAGIARAVQLNLEDAEGRRLQRARPTDAGAMEQVMRARVLLNTMSRQRLAALRAAVPLLEQATIQDPGSVSAWAMLASARALQILNKNVPEAIDEPLLQSAELAAQRALAIDANSVLALLAMGHVKRARNRPDEALQFYERARALNPYYWPLLQEMGRAYTLADRPADAIPLFDLAIRISPKDPGLAFIWSHRCSANLMLENYGQAVADCEKSMSFNLILDSFIARMAIAHAGAGNREKAREFAAEYTRRHPKMTVRSCKDVNHPSRHPNYLKYAYRGCDLLGTVGLPP